MNCPFCNFPDDQLVFRRSEVKALYDKYPISPGHLLIVPEQHVASFSDLDANSYHALMSAILEAKTLLKREWDPDGFNVGINDGIAAGQTLDHAHIHLVPRYKGDIEDARGGVRWILPAKAVYWS